MARFLIRQIGNFTENCQISNLPILFIILSYYAEALTIAKFKIRQYNILMTDSPNLMLTKVSRYVVAGFIAYLTAVVESLNLAVVLHFQSLFQ